jgi:hypothetical protein
MSYKVGPFGSKVTVQLMKRSAGICPRKMPSGITVTSSPRPTLDCGVGDITVNGSMLGQLTRTVWLCGDCGVPLAAAVPAPAKTATMATAKLIRIFRTINPPLARGVARRGPPIPAATRDTLHPHYLAVFTPRGTCPGTVLRARSRLGAPRRTPGDARAPSTRSSTCPHRSPRPLGLTILCAVPSTRPNPAGGGVPPALTIPSIVLTELLTADLDGAEHRRNGVAQPAGRE